MKTAEWIKAAREEWGKTQAELADAVGVSKANVSAWERGKYKPRLEHLMDIADATGAKMPPERHHFIAPQQTLGVNVPTAGWMAALTPAEHRAAHGAPMAYLRLNEAFVELLRPTRTASLRLLHAVNDDMAPTIGAGDPMVIDHDVTEALGDGVYVLDVRGRTIVRRIRQRLDGRYEASCDNPADKGTELISPSVRIIGRVLFVWRGIFL